MEILRTNYGGKVYRDNFERLLDEIYELDEDITPLLVYRGTGSADDSIPFSEVKKGHERLYNTEPPMRKIGDCRINYNKDKLMYDVIKEAENKVGGTGADHGWSPLELDKCENPLPYIDTLVIDEPDEVPLHLDIESIGDRALLHEFGFKSPIERESSITLLMLEGGWYYHENVSGEERTWTDKRLGLL